MKYDLRSDEGWARAYLDGIVPCALFDADGREIDECFAWDDETGEVQRFKVNERGAIEFDENNRPVEVREIRPLPWRMEKVTQ